LEQKSHEVFHFCGKGDLHGLIQNQTIDFRPQTPENQCSGLRNTSYIRNPKLRTRNNVLSRQSQTTGQTGMGDPLGKASGRTFNRTSTSLPDTCWSSPSVTCYHTLKMSNQSSSEDLKSGLPMSVCATMSFICYGSSRMIRWSRRLSSLMRALTRFCSPKIF